MAKGRKQPVRRGRPPIEPNQKKRNNVTLRVRDETKDRLVSAAQESRRSLSEEIEYRVERSFIEEEARHEAFGGREAYESCRMLAIIGAHVSSEIKKPWTRDTEAFNTVLGAWLSIVEGTAKADNPFLEGLMSVERDEAKRRGKKMIRQLLESGSAEG